MQRKRIEMLEDRILLAAGAVAADDAHVGWDSFQVTVGPVQAGRPLDELVSHYVLSSDSAPEVNGPVAGAPDDEGILPQRTVGEGARQTAAEDPPQEAAKQYEANQPIGQAQGLHPGRVTWVHDPDATSWGIYSGYWWDSDSTDQAVVDQMVSKAVRWQAGRATDAAAWDAIFRHFNRTHGGQDVGYAAGEKVAVKLNLNNSKSYADADNQVDTSPQLVLALVRQLVGQAGVLPGNITLYDATRYLSDKYYNLVRAEFPDVVFVDRYGESGRVLVQRDSTSEDQLYLSGGNDETIQLPVCVTQAEYLINLAHLKGHEEAGMTGCAKNHFGSLQLPYRQHDYVDGDNAMGTYNPLVDLTGHKHLGGKTLLYMIDGLYGAWVSNGTPKKWATFGDDWPSSIFVSQDPVAIDSVALDFLRSERPELIKARAENYLHEAALADSPPSETTYDPENDGTPLESLGTHEHWNDATRKQYSRNLGTGEGIELICEEPAGGDDTVGLYAPVASAFHLKNSNSQGGGADLVFRYGPRNLGWQAIIGDWDGDGDDTAGLYDPVSGMFHLKNSNSQGGVADLVFRYGPGNLGWQAVVGDWDGDGDDTVGLYDPVFGVFHLKNSNSQGGGTDAAFRYGPGNLGWQQITGDWDGDGQDTIGLYDPVFGVFHLKNSNAQGGGADLVFRYGPGNLGWQAITGDWNADATDTVGLYDPAAAGFHLKNSNAAGGGADLVFTFGPKGSLGWTPLTGDFDAAVGASLRAAAAEGVWAAGGDRQSQQAKQYEANQPIGQAQGLNPGRVTWVRDPNSTSWNGTSGYWWSDANTNQAVVDEMMSKAVRWQAGRGTDSAAWDAIFRHFNRTRHGQDAGYAAGEKIAVKVNLNNADGYGDSDNEIDSSQHFVLALVRQLVQQAGVLPGDITLYDAIRYFPNRIYNPVHAEFPDVVFVDRNGSNGRVRVQRDATPDNQLYLSGGNSEIIQLPVCVTQAKYVINAAILKGHEQAGITGCAKNHFGSVQLPNRQHTYVDTDNPMGAYNPLVDLIGHKDLGGKTLLYMLDGLYGGWVSNGTPRKWATFDDDWPSSLFVAEDPVAIDSVALDFLRSERSRPAGTENYLHEAALADSPPSGTSYDPDGDGTPLTSLGVHEHWNNAADKQYTRNLGTGEGIELISQDPVSVPHVLYWDQQGDGNWGDIQHGTDNSRWLDDAGNTLERFPDDQSTDAVVRTDTVTVAVDRSARRLIVESGTLMVVRDAAVGLAEDYRITETAEQRFELGPSAGGQVAAAGDVHLAGTLTLQAAEYFFDLLDPVWYTHPRPTWPGDQSREIITAAPGEVNGQFDHVPDPVVLNPRPGSPVLGHIGRGVFVTDRGQHGQGVTYGPHGVQVDVFQAAPGDTNGDRIIDAFDIQRILAAQTFPHVRPADWTTGDFDGDGFCDGMDILLIVMTDLFGAGYYAPVAPAAAHDLALQQAAQVDVGHRGSSSGRVDWLYELDEIGTQQRPSGEDDRVDMTADDLLPRIRP